MNYQDINTILCKIHITKAKLLILFGLWEKNDIFMDFSWQRYLSSMSWMYAIYFASSLLMTEAVAIYNFSNDSYIPEYHSFAVGRIKLVTRFYWSDLTLITISSLLSPINKKDVKVIQLHILHLLGIITSYIWSKIYSHNSLWQDVLQKKFTFWKLR